MNNQGNLAAVEAATGDVHWELSIGTVGKASPVWADGKLYVPETNGHFAIVGPGDDSAEILARHEIRMPDGRRYAEFYGSAAIAYGRIYFTTEEGLYCLGDSDAPFEATASAAPGLGDEGSAEGPPATLLVVPAEVTANPGETHEFQVEAFDAMGRPLGPVDATWSIGGLDAELAGSSVTIPADSGFAAGALVAKSGDLEAEARIRVFPPLPWSEDFSGGKRGLWIGGGRYDIADEDGESILIKPVAERGLLRSPLLIGPPSLGDYTIRADVRLSQKGRRKSDAGLIASGYILDLLGIHQRLQIRSWSAQLRVESSADFEVEMDRWYTMKLRVESAGDTATIRGKVWPRGEDEPADWTVTAVDPASDPKRLSRPARLLAVRRLLRQRGDHGQLTRGPGRRNAMERKIRMGMVGGGQGAFIGAVHRMAAGLDGLIELVCGAFSSDPERSRASGAELFLPPERCYGTFEEMMEREAALDPAERMDFVSIVTPNHLHFPVASAALEAGFHVMSDKPMTKSAAEAEALVELVERTGLVFGLTHNYTGYPMVKEARHRVRGGQLGKVRKIVVEYPQGWLATRLESDGQKQADWRTDPERAGVSCCIGDIGTHAENLAEAIAGLRIESLCADLTTFVDGRPLEDDGNVLLRFDNGARRGALRLPDLDRRGERAGDPGLRRTRRPGVAPGGAEHPDPQVARPAARDPAHLRSGAERRCGGAHPAARRPPGRLPRGVRQPVPQLRPDARLPARRRRARRDDARLPHRPRRPARHAVHRNRRRQQRERPEVAQDAGVAGVPAPATARGPRRLAPNAGNVPAFPDSRNRRPANRNP